VITALVLLLTVAAHAQPPPVLVEITAGGAVHGVPVESTTTIYADQTWRMVTRSTGGLPALTFDIAGLVEFQAGEPARLRFATDYARGQDAPTVVDVVLDCGPRGRGLYVERETGGTTFDDLRVVEPYAQAWRARVARGGRLSALEKELLRCVPPPS
jgi:hypothetical protein